MTTLPKVMELGAIECGIPLLSEVVLGVPHLHLGSWLYQWEEDVHSSVKALQPGEIRPGYVYHSFDLKRLLDGYQVRRLYL